MKLIGDRNIKEKIIPAGAHLVPKKLPKQEQRQENNTKESKLERDLNGKPVLKLIPMEKILVHTPTQEEYVELMRVFECGGWRYLGGSLPTKYNYWKYNREETCISAGMNYLMGGEVGKIGYQDKQICLNEGCKVILPNEFYEIEGVTPEIRKEINEYFDNLES